MATVFIQADKLGAAYRFANLLPCKAQRNYANLYIGWLHGGAEGLEPERGRCTRSAAFAIRQNVDAMKLWEGATI
jgi:hypothetical protein